MRERYFLYHEGTKRQKLKKKGWIHIFKTETLEDAVKEYREKRHKKPDLKEFRLCTQREIERYLLLQYYDEQAI